MAVRITAVEQGSSAHRAGIAPGDSLAEINGNPINDLLDYRFYITEPKLELALTGPRGGYRVSLRKGEYDDIGLEFESYLMDQQRHCKNKCIFCFIDQLPQGLRPSLYFKDDDDRLSFLFGNYITLTNIDEGEIERIIRMRISPINISVHTTDPVLRVQMMKNPKAAQSLAYIGRLTAAGIRVNTQLVLCPGVNDGPQLERSLADLGNLGENLQSISVVPLGLTSHRQGLAQLTPFTPQSAGAVIDVVEAFSEQMLRRRGSRVAYPADEFFLKAGRPLPPAGYYGDFEQLENGVGMLALMQQEFTDALEDCGVKASSRRLSIATGMAAGPFITRLAEQACRRIQGLEVRVHSIPNRLLGPTITVAGLVSGGDISHALAGQDMGEELLIPVSMLRKEGDRFLDDMTPQQLGAALKTPVRPVPVDGYQLLDSILGIEV